VYVCRFLSESPHLIIEWHPHQQVKVPPFFFYRFFKNPISNNLQAEALPLTL